MFSGLERPSHWLVIAVIVVLLFGYKKLPDAARSVGRSLRIFKAEIKGMNEDDAARDVAKKSEQPPAAPPAAAESPEIAPTRVTDSDTEAAPPQTQPPASI